MRAVGKEQTIKIHQEPIHKTLSSRIYSGTFDEKDIIVKRVSVDNHKSELGHLRKLDNINVVKYLFHDKDEDFIYIVLEKCDTTLQQYIDRNKEGLNHYGLLWQLVEGMVYIHEVKHIIHRDLKPSNILLVQRDGEWTVKISDFGISKELPPDQSHVSQSMSGSFGYMAPECQRGEHATRRSDMFSIGLIFVYVVSEGEHPYGDDTRTANENIIQAKMSPNMGCVKCGFRHDVDKLIRNMISWDPNNRPSIKEVQAHHMFWKPYKKLLFIQDISDFLIKDDETCKEMQKVLESEQAEVAPNWRRAISEKSELIGKVIQDMKNKKQKDGVCDLLRNIRNLLHHYDEKVKKFEGFDREIGDKYDGSYCFFSQLFPKLWDYVYTAMKKYSSEFQHFYEYNASEHLVLKGNLENLERETMQDQQSQKKKTRELVLRSYQWELAEQALKGDNSLIVAPTGAGKTVVLTQIIKDHLAKNPDGRVMFMVPKTALARQQSSFLKRHLPKGLKIEFMIGELTTVVPVGKVLLNSQVTVLTHQVLINELKREDSDRYLSFDDISLLIFDECHATHGNHPYRVLMNLLLDFKDRKPEDIATQVVGVTASPGVGKGRYKDKVYQNLIRLLANLNITSAPVTVVEHIDELQNHCNKIKESLLQIETEQLFSNEIQTVIVTIEKVITKKILEGTQMIRASPGNKSAKAYDNWVHDLILHAKQHIADGETARKVIALAEHLYMYHSLLQLKDLIPEATKAVSSMVNFGGTAQENKFLKKVYDGVCEKAVHVQTPMVECLEDIIFEEFEHNANARCMIFVKRRQTAAFLREYLAGTDKLKHLKPLYMIGRHSREGEDYPGTDQVIVRRAFEEGSSKVLICTSVAEEGLDFVACSLVIMYNYVTGEVGRIQRSGRARAKKSRAIIITSIHSNHAKRELENKLCAEATAIAIEDVKNKERMDREGLIREIREDQRREKIQRRLSEAASQDLERSGEPEKWKVLCAHCKNYLTTGDKLRNLDMHTVVCDEEFNLHTEKDFIEKEKGMLWGDVDYLCNNEDCRIKVAWGMVKNGRRYPTVTIRKILLADEEGRFVSPGQKKNIPFKISKKVVDDDNTLYEATSKRGPADESKPVDEETCIEILDIWDACGDD